MATNSFPPGLWALAPCHFQALPDNHSLIIRADNGAVSLQAGHWQPALRRLDAFRALQQHLDVLLAKNPALRSMEQQVRDFLLRLHGDGLLISGQGLADQLAQAPAAPCMELPPLRIAVITCDRPHQLDRLLDSLAENESAHGNTWAYEIVDDSRHPDSAVQNQALIARHGARLDLRYHGRAEREACLTRLAAVQPGGAEHLRWLLDSWDSAHVGQATYGSPKNYLMLRFAGERLLFIDDDTVMRAWIHPKARKAFRFGEVGRDRTLAEDWETLTGGLKPLRRDPIADHAAVLGRGLAEARGLLRLSATANDLFAQASWTHVAAIDPGRARIRGTMSALVGDPGTVYDISLFIQDSSVRNLAADDAAYRRFLSRPRCVFNGETGWTLTNQGYFMLSTMAGIDLSLHLPPLFPTGRGEDLMMGRWLKLLHPQDMALIAPWGLEHRAEPPRSWRTLPEDLPMEFTAATAWGIWAGASGLDGCAADPATKLEALRSHFLTQVTDVNGAQQLREQLNAAARQIWARHYTQLLQTHLNSAGLGTQWRSDILQALTRHQTLLQAPAALPRALVETLVEQNRRYFAALDTWHRAQEWVRGGGPDLHA